MPIIIFFLLYDKIQINEWFKKFFPEKLDLSRRAYAELDLKIGNYIRCKLIEIIIVWISSTIFFALLGLNYSLLLGFLCGISVIIPYVGAIAVTIPIVVVAYFQWGTSSEFWYVLIAHILIQVIDGNVVVPILFSDAVNLHPLAILIAILFFGTIIFLFSWILRPSIADDSPLNEASLTDLLSFLILTCSLLISSDFSDSSM